ncbi:hypothetical protein DEU56DRAFT_767978 [Suillus clintonianus]|uniref:uncharacterized protein n=1 Tax=Suillus clintonianus TaxID=1904413 RepID=UPI001B8735CC|nr:uncharacterized protein DEU56DRAFT_767978 [Suillus clintonianus]KAG2155546.1 hypothetical protein DEU56DRAFT_767978 [Suillus clintonianus]
MPGEATPPSGVQPLIPERFLDVPSQRLYYLSLGLLLQAIKVFDVLQNFFASDATTYYGRKWLIVDFAYIATLSRLRIPRLKYSRAVVLLQILSIWFLDGMLFGGISLNLGLRGSSEISSAPSGIPNRPDLPSTPEPFRLSDLFAPLTFGLFSFDTNSKDAHLLGQHTVRMSPISTAHFNPHSQTFCLPPVSSAHVLVPILVNNTTPTNVRYSFTPLGSGRVEYLELGTKELKAIEQARVEGLQVVRSKDAGGYDEYDDEDDEETDATARLQNTQSLVHLRFSKPGTIKLDRVLDSSNVAARLVHPVELTVVPCPTAQYADDAVQDVRCAGDTSGVDLTIDLRGVPPLSLQWSKDVNGRKEYFLVEGIEDSGHSHTAQEVPRARIPQKLKIPLSLSLDALGKHTYNLESVIDGMGNIVQLNDGHHDTKTTRSLSVLRRPSVSFKACGPGNPTLLLIGSEAPVALTVSSSDSLDGPWDIDVRFEPTNGDGKRMKPWDKTLQTQKDKNDVVLKAGVPGEYVINGIRGKYCDGDVLAPETCRVVEKAMPTAEIEWKRIHECSGDTGVSASLVIHGTPPFQVYYRTQRDAESPRDLFKTFTSSRGELTLQPEHSGHYHYTFLQLSDAYYKKVALDGPSIDQIVHPLAAADFVAGRGRRVVSSCEGATVDIEVDLRGTPPWNLELQVVGPRSTDALEITDIKTSPTRITVPIPSVIDKEGGTFDVELVSVVDSYGCRRSISVPGVSVNVRRVKPTAKFYGKHGQREITILEDDGADLPLRLTGDGPWKVKYRYMGNPDRMHTVVLKSPNDNIHVTQKGVYEILEVMDSQCPGSVIASESTYTVDWVPRPYARLDPATPCTFEPYNRSHILPPICKGQDAHVDLELTGRPPFQIMYNIARNDEAGGTIVLDQPTFSSIQPHTRFQLHTSIVGRKYYEVKQIGDSAYPLAKHKNSVIPRSDRLLFEQEVMPRPSAKFKNDNRILFCLNDALTSREAISNDGGVIQLEGTPPFQLALSIRNLAASQVHKETIEVHDKTWMLDLPSYHFTSIGPHQITIESVQDSSHCEQKELHPLRRSIWVDVAESAAITPVDKRVDFCVGDVSQFQLEGTPPWSIGYRINGKSYTQESKKSPFSLMHQQAGEFTVTSVSQQQKLCKATVTDLQFSVHPLPAAQVGHGKRIFQDIHEGDQAEIIFTLIGEPPFTFTYQRAEPIPKKGGKSGKVLETHTVSGVTTHEYSIFSALEGTWTVTSISDRYCRYPTQPDGVVEKTRH